jgi:predicted HAD superfamily hydrolase
MNHHTNLVVQILFKIGIVDKFEDVLQSLYANFSHNPKKTQEFVELVNIMEIRVGENLRNIKTH